jgi:hypothetical protein
MVLHRWWAVAALLLPVITPMPVAAHMIAGAQYNLTQDQGQWLLSIGFGPANIAASRVPGCAGLSRVEACLATHLRQTIDIRMNGRRAQFGRGAIMPGSHMSMAVFLLEGVPADPWRITARITSFQRLDGLWPSGLRVRAPQFAFDGDTPPDEPLTLYARNWRRGFEWTGAGLAIAALAVAWLWLRVRMRRLAGQRVDQQSGV